MSGTDRRELIFEGQSYTITTTTVDVERSSAGDYRGPSWRAWVEGENVTGYGHTKESALVDAERRLMEKLRPAGANA